MAQTKAVGAPRAAKPKLRRGSLLWRIVEHKYLYLMLLPGVVSVFLFCYVPMSGLILAFKELKFNASIYSGPWAGLTYFKAFFNDPFAKQLLINTVGISACKIFLAFPFPIILALMLNEVRNARYKKVTQTISYLPHFVAWVVVAAIIERVFAPNTGLINQLRGAFGADPSYFFMMEKDFFYPAMFLSYLWKTMGWSSIIFLAAISGIDPGYYEAAKIDGANKWDEITKITLPCIKPTIGLIFIMSLGDILKAGFEQIYLLRTAGNMVYADILDTFVIRAGLEQGNFSYATAVGMLQGVAGLVLVVVANWLSRKYTEVALW